eukprot:1911219-Amphidinium_carterae.1
MGGPLCYCSVKLFSASLQHVGFVIVATPADYAASSTLGVAVSSSRRWLTKLFEVLRSYLMETLVAPFVGT